MSSFKELDPDIIRNIIDGQENVLESATKKQEALFRNSICPLCRSVNLQVFLDSVRPFSSGSLLPNKLLKCSDCKTEFDPYTNMITKAATDVLG